jgi:OFA family oxalate/formate antiporter-like MFS transporter
MSENLSAKGWTVALAGTGINLALGVLYTWSVISKAIPKEWGWTEAQRALPYSIACIVFALMMVPAGKMQDKIGPRWVATMGGVLTGLGLLLASRFTTVPGFVLGFGVLAGAGIGLGYASATPPAVKWFPPMKTGMIAGIVVAGFGLASVYISPTAKALLARYGVSGTLMIFGVAFLIVVCLLSQLLRNPSDAERKTILASVPVPVAAKAVGAQAAAPAVKVDFTATEMMKTSQFYLLWVMYVFAAGAGLMIIGKLVKMVELQTGSKAGFILVALLAVGNASGRIVAGTLSDKIGRVRTMLIVFLFQAVLMFLMRGIDQFSLFIALAMLVGFNYGANLSVFPSITKDWFGLKNFGVNYGLVFTAWGVGGFLLPLISGKVFDATGKFDLAYMIAGALLLVAAAITFITKAPAPRHS